MGGRYMMPLNYHLVLHFWWQHAAVASGGSIEISSIKCVVDSTLCYTMPNVIPLQVQGPLIPPPASWPEVHQEFCIPGLSPLAVGSVLSHLLALRNTCLDYKGRIRVWKCDEKRIMRFYFNLRMRDLPLLRAVQSLISMTTSYKFNRLVV